MSKRRNWIWCCSIMLSSATFAQVPDSHHPYFVSGALHIKEGMNESRADREVVAALSHFLDGVHLKSRDILVSNSVADMLIISMRPAGLRHLTVEQLATYLGQQEGDIANWVTSAEVRTDSDLAEIWTTYDFYQNGKVRSCGSEVFSFVKTNGRWLVAGVADNVHATCK